MTNSNLIKIISSLSKDEMRDLEDFIISPYFNKKPTITNLFKELKKYYPDYKSEDTVKEKIYAKIYPGKKFNDGILRNQMSELYRLVLKFIGIEGFNRENFEFRVHISKELLNRGLQKTFVNNYEDIKRELEKNDKIQNEYYYFNRAILDEQNEDNLIFSNEVKVPVNNLYGNNFLYFTLIKLFKIMHNLHATEVNLNVYYDKSILRKFISFIDIEKVLDSIKEVSVKDHKIVSIYYYMSRSLIDFKDNESFLKFYDLIENNYQLFAEGERFTLYIYLNNIASHNIVGKQKLLDIYKSMLNKKIYKFNEKAYLSHVLFSYILTNAIHKKELKWLEGFIDEYIPELEPENQENMMNYSKAHLFFQNKDHNRSLEHLMKVKADNFFFKHQTYKLIIQNYYELKDDVQIEFAIDNFRHFISKGNLSDDWKYYYNNFITAVKELIKLRSGKEKSKFKIESVIDNNIGDYSWIEEHIKNLKHS